MRLQDLAGHIGHSLVEDMKRLAMGFKDFPFYVHLKGHGQEHRDKFSLFWTMKPEHFGSPNHSDIVSELYCEVVGEFEGRILLHARAFSRRKYLGQILKTSVFEETPDWYKQEWREAYFLIEAKAEVLWTLMEAHADFDRAVREVHES